MLVLNNTNTEDAVIVTLEESRTINDPYYLFVFTNTTTKEVVNHIVNSADDESNFINRFNKFTFDTSTIFDGATLGQWQYQVYEQVSSTNTDVTSLNMVECGKMVLKTTEQTIFTGYTPATTYTGYNG